MPCYDPYAMDDYADAKYGKMATSLNERTAQLCELCRELERRGLIFILNAPTLSWWEAHKKRDTTTR